MTKKAYDILKEAEKFGSKKQKDGTILLGHVPHIAPEAWFHILFAPLKEKGEKALEKKLGRKIPEFYKIFLALHNGLISFSGSLYLEGYRKNYDRSSNDLLPFDISTVNVDERPEDSLDTHFFIGGYDWDGSLLYNDGKSAKIYRCLRDTVEPLNKWADLDSMLNDEIARLNGIFKLGKKKDEEQPTTP